MQFLLIAGLSLHVLAAVFWGGSTFVLARSGALGAVRLFRPQMVAAAITVGSGGYLGHLVHGAVVGPAEKVLAIGAVAAIAALIIQAAVAGPVLWSTAPGDTPGRSSRVVMAYRVSAGLLAIATVAMASSRYV